MLGFIQRFVDTIALFFRYFVLYWRLNFAVISSNAFF